MLSQRFAKVWYRSKPLGVGEITLKAMEDSGSLTAEPGSIRFDGKKKGTIEIRDIKRVSAATAGRDFVNKWVTVEYGADQVAMFVNAGMLGWSGILGGNRKLLAALESAVEAGGADLQ